ncbi:hypothetical protein CIL05_17975 [Virgibacillus profundi]|uniref:Uncharacterized protein n=1 Tax=Virgibacillus profundi TaxID=2024555 RepID=A0A2A2IAT5_9BACI|nr:VCBS repeat-containing protein [Virgibacillus profundi]PAV28255.1 hypothetical protein CIL05_17975 [Virgibacillus profundi]PXY52559.1 VCBS repeat-containing protein [Virgibacillus profundi]
MKMIRFIIILLTVFICSTIEVHAAERQKDPDEIVKDFLPVNSELVKAEEPVGTKAIQRYDFDSDGQAELIVTFKEKDQLKAMVLKKESGQWKKVWEVTGEGFDIHYSGLEDMDGNGAKEYLIGWMIGASAGNELEIFQWQNGSLHKLNDTIPYHKLETLNEGKQTYLAVWQRFCCDAYTVEVLKWNGTKFIQDDKMFMMYYPKIKAFYEEKISKMDAWYYWYALADAQVKANLLQEAVLSIEKGLTLDPDNEQLLKLKKKLELGE